MAYGYMGKILMVDLSKGEINEEIIPDDIRTLQSDFLDCIGWDKETAVPTKAKLMELGLEDVAMEIAG